MDLAKKILEKFGWKDGDGLGRNADGIAKPIKASMKFDKAGLGSNFAKEELNNHWWQRVFDEAAGNIQVIREEGEQSVRMGIKNTDDTLEISTKTYSVKKLEKLRKERQQKQNSESIVNYGNFIPASKKEKNVLSGIGSNCLKDEEKKDIDDISVTPIKILSDEELFAACGGRTAHKGARHGLYLNGKLARLQKQEMELLEQLKTKNHKQNDLKDINSKESDSISAKIEDSSQICDDKELNQSLITSLKPHKRKRKHKEKEQLRDNSEPHSNAVTLVKKKSSEHKKKKKRKDQSKEEEDSNQLIFENDSSKRKKKKKSNKKEKNQQTESNFG